MTLTSLSPAEWCGLLAAWLLFLGPGVALLSLYRGAARFDKTIAVPIAFGLSLSFWAVLMGWLQLIRLALNPLAAAAILGLGWIVALLRWRSHLTSVNWHWSRPWRVDGSRLALWLIVVGTTGISIFALRHFVAGLGSDSYHHSLIVQLIADRGMLPSDYLPYASLVTFRYHYGFHAFAAVLVWLTGLKAAVLTPLAAQILMGFAAWSVAFFTEALTRNRTAAVLSAGVVGLASVFPAYYVNFGRDTQLAGLTILPIFLGLVWDWPDRRPVWSEMLMAGLLAAGVALTHYRIVLMAVLGVLVLLGWRTFSRRRNRAELLDLLSSFARTSAIAFAAAVPWLWHVWSTRHQGFEIILSPATTEAFSLDRLSPGALGYPTNAPLMLLLFAALALGWWWRDSIVRPLSLWAFVLLLASGPSLLGSNMDTVTVVLSIYLPAGVILGWMIVRVIDRLEQPWVYLRPVAFAAAALLFLRGALGIAQIGQSWAPYVFPRDLRAVQWIDANTPSAARFMVNTFHFAFWPSYVLGSDAGWWLPLLAGRRAVTVPLTYPLERASSPGFAEELVALDQLDGHLASPQALALMQSAQIDYVYVGERGGQIDVGELLESPAFKEEYQDGPVHIFRFLGATSGLAAALP